MAVQRLLQSLLVKGMAYQSYGSCKDEEAIQVANLHNVLDLSLQEGDEAAA